jgi:GNAT superfamily N-acetyltransferase
MNLDIRPATRERAPAVAAMVARAFADDPMIRWSLGPDDLPNRMRRYFTLISEQWADLGVLWESGDAAGAAAWITPDQQNGLADQNAQLRDAFHALTSDGGVRHDALWNWVESRIPHEPLWFLDLVAVEPERQRGGVGRALIELGLARAAADHVPAFLETGVERNVAYYERFGFRVVDDDDSPLDGPHVWFMRSDPDRDRQAVRPLAKAAMCSSCSS